MATKKKAKPRYAPGSREGVGGRPARTGERATHVLHATVSEDEYNVASSAADRAGVSLADFVRTSVAKAAKKQ